MDFSDDATFAYDTFSTTGRSIHELLGRARCRICGVIDEIPNDEFKGLPCGEVLFRPCLCSNYVHLNCALSAYRRKKCPKCGVPYFYSPSEMLSWLANADAGARERFARLPICLGCSKKVFVDGRGGSRRDHEFIRPCRCDTFVHHGCMTVLAPRFKRCSICHEKFHYRTYGSVWDFVLRNKCTTLTPLVMYLTVICLGIFAGSSIIPLKPTSQPGSFTQIVMLCGVLLVLILSTICIIYWNCYLSKTKWRFFRERYGQTTVFWSQRWHPVTDVLLSSYEFSEMARYSDEVDSASASTRFLSND